MAKKDKQKEEPKEDLKDKGKEERKKEINDRINERKGVYDKDYIIKNARKRFGKQTIYRLRWVFHYHDGKPSRRGVWNGATQKPSDMAAFVDKTNLLKACIEGEINSTGLIETLLEINGQDYATCQWEAAAVSPAFLKHNKFKANANIIGLSMLDRKFKHTVYINGQTRKEKLSEGDKKMKIKEHQLGV